MAVKKRNKKGHLLVQKTIHVPEDTVLAISIAALKTGEKYFKPYVEKLIEDHAKELKN